MGVINFNLTATDFTGMLLPLQSFRDEKVSLCSIADEGKVSECAETEEFGSQYQMWQIEF